MKHLKTYNESCEYDNAYRAEIIKNDIMDMTLDIQDEGFNVKTEDDKDPYYPSFGYAPDLHITIHKFDKGYRENFHLNQVKDFLLRLLEYDRTNPCQIEIFVPNKNHVDQKVKITYSNKIYNGNEIGFVEYSHGGYNGREIDYKVSYVFINVRIFK